MLSRKSLAFLIKIAVTAALLWLVFRSVDVGVLRRSLARLDANLLVLMVLVCWAGQLFCAQRWRLFARSLGMGGSYWNYMALYFAGMLFNIGLPSLIGGDAVKAYVAARRAGKPLVLGIASVLQDRAVGLVSLLIYGGAALLAAPLAWRGIPMPLVYLLAGAGAAAFFVLAWKGQRIYEPLLARGDGSRLTELARRIADFHGALVTMRMPASSALQIVVYSFLNSGLVLWMFQQISVAAGEPVGLAAFSVLFPIISIVTMLPISLGGLGIREWAYVEGLAMAGVPAESALLIALTTSALIIVCDSIGIFFLPVIPSELRRVAAGGNPQER